MELILRYAQRTMPPSQVGVVCKNAGMRYRWFALGGLVVIGASGGAMVLRVDSGDLAARAGSPALSLADPYGRTMLLLTAAWLALLATVAWMAFWLHPAQRKRSHPGMTEPEIGAERQRVGRAIKRMDHALKFELVVSVVALAIGASLHSGGLF
jgi:hypothetical protein